jgi:2-polyprenyl-6-hydroxyphenyl methylase/3-demethylubiquinone-9 3-methyltransferase
MAHLVARLVPELPRNDVRQYDELAEAWSDPDGAFAALYWLAEARAELVPPAERADAVLLDVACGGGLFAPHARRLGYRHHVGVDLSRSGLDVARTRGVLSVQGDAALLPIASGSADVVVAGEVLEHVTDLPAVVAEVCRVLRPGGTVVLDSIADTWFGRFSSVTVGERIPGGPPVGIHDPALFVDREELHEEFARHGVPVTLQGLRLPVWDYFRWAWARKRRRRAPARRPDDPAPSLSPVRLRKTGFTGGLFQGAGTKRSGAGEAGVGREGTAL